MELSTRWFLNLSDDHHHSDLGNLVEAYTEVARRLDIMAEGEPVAGTGPKLVQ